MGTVTIFEGADGAGKTTLIEALRQRHAALVLNHGPYLNETSIARHYLASLEVARDGDVFMDRSWLAEPIYGNAYRHGSDRIGVASRRMLDRVALSLGGVVVRCAPLFNVCAATFTRRAAKHGEYLDNVDQLRAVYNGYQEDLRTDLSVVDFDYMTMTTEDLWSRVEAARPLKNGGPGVGHWAPGKIALLVGDQMNSRGTWDLPFVSFNRHGCSAWLADGLEKNEVSEAGLYWINSTGLDGRPLGDKFINELQPTKIIALGERAATWCDGHGLDHKTVVPHPQFFKRFKAGQAYPLFGLLQEVL